jgi:hypothetical protein
MRTTHHVLTHPACTVELDLDEGTGIFHLRFREPHRLPDPNFRKALHRWCGRIGLSWARHFGAIAGDRVSLHFFQLPPPKGSCGYRGKFKNSKNEGTN